MADNFDRILDDCLDRLNRGESLDSCLEAYPEYSEQLGPLLRTTLRTTSVFSIVPSADKKRLARQQFLDALERKGYRGKSSFFRVFLRPVVWAALIVAVLAVGYIGLGPSLFSIAAVPDPQGNLAFLISDDVNAISDFESLTVSISKIGVLGQGGVSGRWVEFTPEVTDVDLTLVQGEKTQEVWRGNVPEGSYTKVFIYVTEVQGILKETGQTVEVKVPSQKLQITDNFEVAADSVTSFTYDLTVVSAGNAQSGIKYILKPQVGDSGATQKTKDKKGNDRVPGSSGAKSTVLLDF